MQIDIITAFPTMLDGPLSQSIIARAVKQGLVTITTHDLRRYTTDKHRTIDDTPYGGGGGMILKADPIFACIEDLLGLPEISSANHVRDFVGSDVRIIAPMPQGEVFTQKKAVELSLQTRLIFICGHYKGIDERVHDKLITDACSVGDYVLTGGELPAMVMIDAAIRLIPGALHDSISALTDSFQDELLDCPYYTRPDEYRGMKVPEALLSGNHAAITQWREEKKKEITRKVRPDLVYQTTKKK
ncbi:tRNA (guanosine(37)-N1)-methyltransferase TrmD [bacterium]|nr:tRNA (guanosine(37)-N1)-methyltransferase TrmD [bacterium]